MTKLFNWLLAAAIIIGSAIPASADRYFFRYGGGVLGSMPGSGPGPSDPGSPADIDAHFLVVVGEQIDIPLPTLPAASATSWKVESGWLPVGIGFDEEELAFQGTPAQVTSQTLVRLGGYSMAGNRVADADVAFTVLEQVHGSVRADLYGHTDRHMHAILPNPGNQPIAQWVLLQPLPEGLDLLQTGHVTGIPAQPGYHSLAISGLNGLGEQIRFVHGLIVIEDGPVIGPVQDSLVKVGESIAIQPTVKRKVGQITWQIEGDPLPAGLKFSQVTGLISGAVSTFETSATLRFRAIDSDGTHGLSNDFVIATGGRVVDIASAGDRTMVEGVYGGFGFSASGLSGEQTWSLVEGNLPEGVSLDPETGYVAGTPTVTGRSEGIVISVVTSVGGEAATAPFAVDVVQSMIAPAELGNTDGKYTVRAGQNFATGEIAMSGGTAPYRFEIAQGGVLPQGLELDEWTGVLSGQMEDVGSHAIPLVAFDDEGRRSATITLQIGVYLPLSVAVPDIWAATRAQSMEPIQAIVPGNAVMPSPAWPHGMFSGVGTFPPGVSVNASTGRVDGIPLAEGTFGPLRIRIEDASGEDALSGTFMITVGPRLPLEATSLATSLPRLVQFHIQAGMAANAIGDVTWTLQSGSLPAGVTLTADGHLTGLTSATGTAGPLVLLALDGEGETAATAPFSLPIVVPKMELSVKDLTWAAGRHFSTPSPAVASSVGARHFSAEGLPQGVTIDPHSGVLSGTVAVPGSYEIDVSVTDEIERVVTAPQTLTILDPMTLSVTPIWEVARASHATLVPVIGNAIGAVSFSLQGDLPPGLSFDMTSGRISGSPVEEGAWRNLTLSAVDFAGTVATTPLEVEVGQRLPLDISFGNGVIASIRGHSVGWPKFPKVDNAVGQVSYLMDGTLPPGVSFLPSSGAFAGPATQAGIWNGVTVTGTDSEGATVVAEVAFHIGFGRPIGIANTVHRNIRQGVWTATAPILPTSVVHPLDFRTASGGVFPCGLTLDSLTGSVSGVLEQASCTASLTVTDALGASASFTLHLIAVGDLSVGVPSQTSFNQHFMGEATLPVSNAIGSTSLELVGSLPPGMTFDPSTGRIFGTPQQQGTWSGLQVTARDMSGDEASSPAFSLTVGPRLPLEATVIASTSAIANMAFAVSPSAGNSVGQVTWELLGELPPGLTFNPSNGRISGVPTTLGDWTGIGFRATDSIGGVATSGPLAISVITDGLPISLTVHDLTGKAGYPIQTLAPTVSNNVGEVTFHSLSPLPAGLTLNPTTGVVSGTVQQAGSYPLNIHVTDSSNRLTSRTLMLEVLGPLQVVSPLFSDRTVNQTASPIITTVMNAIGSLTWSMEGTLPTGMAFNATNGRIEGTPTQIGVFAGIYVTATDSFGDTASGGETVIQVHDSGILPTVSFAPPGDYRVGQSFNQLPSVTGSKYGDVFTLNGALPEGLSLNSTTGRISGTFTAGAPGLYEGLVLTLTDSNGYSVSTDPFDFRVAHENYFSFANVTQQWRRGVHFTAPAPVMSGGYVGDLVFSKSGTWPSTLHLDPASGVVSGSHGSSATLAITASDAMASSVFTFSYQPLDLAVTDVTIFGFAGEAVTSTQPAVSHAIGGTTFDVVGDLPGTLSISASTGVIFGTMPTEKAEGLRIRVTDQHGSALSPPFSIEPAAAAYTHWRVTIEPGTHLSGNDAYATIDELQFISPSGENMSLRAPLGTAAITSSPTYYVHPHARSSILRAVDGNHATDLPVKVAPGTNRVWVALEFQQPESVDRVFFSVQSDPRYGGRRPRVYGSNNGTDWTYVMGSSNGFMTGYYIDRNSQ